MAEATQAGSVSPSPLQATPAASGRRGPLLALAALAFAGAAFAAAIVVPRLYYERTDDAYVHANIVSVIPKLSAYVARLHVTDNSHFLAGQLLIELDPRDFVNAVAAAQADLAAAEASKTDTEAMLAEQVDVIGRASAAVSGDKATNAFAAQQLSRYSTLADTGYGTEQRKQQAESDIGQSQANLRRDEAALAEAEAHRRTLQAQLKERDAAIERAGAQLAQKRLDLSYTNLYAVADGTVANRHVEAGNFVQPGQLLLSAVPDDVFIFANYKEMQVARMREGQAVRIAVDALGGVVLRGHVDSFQRGTGSTFALLPPENATGNFVKVVQRIPVKIRFDEPATVVRRLAPGMSVETAVVVEPPPPWLAWTYRLP